MGASTVVARGLRSDFRARLSGRQEVPPVATQAEGQAHFRLSPDGETLHYRLLVRNIVDVLQAHIHCGPAGANGPVVAFLYPDAPPAQLIPGPFSGVLAEGTRTDANIVPQPDSPVCPGGVADLDDLLTQMRSGNTYVNVHTVANPAGEIRGQIR
ncbi:MAG: CHRD domain-containing protein [Anaerolineaceae bacterium]|nr:CHRD domain-containing protein [Anaerolineaceae bacterium]